MSNCLLFACLPRRQIFLSCNVLKKYRAVFLDIKIISCNCTEIYLRQHKSVGIRSSRFLKNIERKRASTLVFYPDIRHMGQARRFQAPQHLFYKERICKRKKCVDASCRRSAITLIKSEFILISEYHLLENAENSLSDTADDRYIMASAER